MKRLIRSLFAAIASLLGKQVRRALPYPIPAGAAPLVLTDCFVSINSVDLSDHVRQVTINYAAELIDDTVMGDSTRSRIGGLKDWSMTIEFLQDFAASEVDVTLFSLVGTTFTVEVRPTSDAASATNPSYEGTGILENYNPLGNSVGELAMAPITIQSAGDLSRATS